MPAAKTVDEIRALVGNPSKASRSAIPIFVDLIPKAGITSEDAPCAAMAKLVIAYAHEYETGSFPFGWTTAACIAMLDAGLHPPIPRSISAVAWEVKNRRRALFKHAQIDEDRLEQAARIMNGEDE